MPVVCSMSGLALGMNHKEKRSSALNEAKAQIACYERFGNDLLVVEYGLHGIGIALGSNMNDPEESVPAIMSYVLEDLNDVDKLDMSKLELKNDKLFQLHIEAAEILIDKLGKEVPTGVLISGPFTAAASIYKTENFLRATRKNPEKVHELVKFCTEALKMICREFIKRGVLILLCDPIASGTILNRKQYLEFVLPYTIDLMKDKVPILGNVDPVEVLILGSTQEVDSAVKTCMQKAYDSPCGYILASGCDLSGNVPLENIDQFMASARKYGKWPIDMKNFM